MLVAVTHRIAIGDLPFPSAASDRTPEASWLLPELRAGVPPILRVGRGSCSRRGPTRLPTGSSRPWSAPGESAWGSWRLWSVPGLVASGCVDRVAAVNLPPPLPAPVGLVADDHGAWSPTPGQVPSPIARLSRDTMTNQWVRTRKVKDLKVDSGKQPLPFHSATDTVRIGSPDRVSEFRVLSRMPRSDPA